MRSLLQGSKKKYMHTWDLLPHNCLCQSLAVKLVSYQEKNSRLKPTLAKELGLEFIVTECLFSQARVSSYYRPLGERRVNETNCVPGRFLPSFQKPALTNQFRNISWFSLFIKMFIFLYDSSTKLAYLTFSPPIHKSQMFLKAL